MDTENPHVRCKMPRNPFHPLTNHVVTSSSANNQLRHMRILSLQCYEDDISIGAHQKFLTLMNNLGLHWIIIKKCFGVEPGIGRRGRGGRESSRGGRGGGRESSRGGRGGGRESSREFRPSMWADQANLVSMMQSSLIAIKPTVTMLTMLTKIFSFSKGLSD